MGVSLEAATGVSLGTAWPKEATVSAFVMVLGAVLGTVSSFSRLGIQLGTMLGCCLVTAMLLVELGWALGKLGVDDIDIGGGGGGALDRVGQVQPHRQYRY
jgi:hypothetical protein